MRKTKDDAEKTRLQLLDSAYHVFLQQGYDAATISEIASHASLTRGAAYWHFKSKEDIFISVIEKALDDEQTQKNAYISSDKLSLKEKLVSVLSLPLSMKDNYQLVNSIPALAARFPEFDGLLSLLQQRKQNLQQFFVEFLASASDRGEIALHGTPRSLGLMLFVLFEGLYFSSTQQETVTSNDINAFVESIIEFR